MDNLQKAGMYSVVFTVAGYIGSLFQDWMAFIAMLLHLLIVGHFIAEDAVSRKKSKFHQLWAFLGIIGFVIYYFAFAKNN